MPTTKITQDIRGNRNRQEINIIIDSLRKRKRSKPKPKPEPEQPQELQPLTMEDLASSVKPVMYPPTNVITVNPYNMPQPTMFDLAKQQKLNTMLNNYDDMKQNIADLRVNMQHVINAYIARGDTKAASEVQSKLDAMESMSVPSEASFDQPQMVDNAMFGEQPTPTPEEPNAEPNPEYQQQLEQMFTPVNNEDQYQYGTYKPPEETPIPDDLGGRTFWSRLTPRELRYAQPTEPGEGPSNVPATPLQLEEPEPEVQLDDEENQIIDSVKDDIQASQSPYDSMMPNWYNKELEGFVNKYNATKSQKERQLIKTQLQVLARSYINEFIVEPRRQQAQAQRIERQFEPGKHFSKQVAMLKKLFS